MKLFLLVTFLLIGVGCVGPQPVMDEVLSETAIRYADDVGAESTVASYLVTAKEKHNLAKRLLKDRKYSEAKKIFNEARSLAEKIETKAKIDQLKSGDLF